jgi:ABC-type uncharacterized transport system permease subunit
MEAWLEAAVRLAAPLLLAALGELVVERSGVVNIGVEGMMLTGAFAGFAVAVATGSPALGCAGGALAGVGVGAVFGAAAIGRGADQIVVGTAVNLLALGATGLFARSLYAGHIPTAPTFPVWPIPWLSELPVAGSALFRQSPFVYGAFLAAAAVGVFLARTRPGLRLRAVGESARAADAEGVSVPGVRAAALLVGAAFAGLAGASLPLAQTNTFTEGMTAGRGFVALAIVIFGRYRPGGVVAAALFFGAASALQFRLQAQGFGVPYPLLLMFPYAVTLVVLALASSRARGPADLGRAYRREAH